MIVIKILEFNHGAKYSFDIYSRGKLKSEEILSISLISLNRILLAVIYMLFIKETNEVIFYTIEIRKIVELYYAIVDPFVR